MGYEIHHIGQLSIWARQLNLQPVSANLIEEDDIKNRLASQTQVGFIYKKIFN